ncbi:BTAD domain-containing putative transcriptional regulator [Glycomyces harbinensis]|uniref:BTAD domain-containing putative transcriptional regulator n=1 Tax=Glycomyces harbinensis TaxID=58114 RepID=UPI000B856683
MHIGLLGSFEVRTDDGVLADVPGARLRALLIALALEPRRVVQKSTLVDWIWGEYPPADAANALQRLVSRLRKTLPDGSIEGQTGGYRLEVSPDDVDALRFERLVAQARNEDEAGRVRLLREALGLWRGPAMQDVGLQDGAAFDAAVTRLESLRLSAMEDRFDAEIATGHGADLVPQLTDLVAAQPMRERLVGALMRALAAAGRGSEALVVYENTREALADALGVDPSPELSALHVALLRGELGRPAPERRDTNLRAELTSFVGRGDDLAVVRELVAEHRLTTLIGPGGAGKTRLSTEAARSLLDGFPDGAWLVELAPLTADGDPAQATLTALGLRDTLLGDAPDLEPTARLVAAIRDREALLVLDNCEHVIEAVAVFADRVLGECRRLRILATSREPLGITGEALWLVDPLALPESDADPGDAEDSPAFRLLRDRASAVRKDLADDAHAVAAMVRICRALDGMPLAIELAAARLRTMTLDQLANGLHDRFRLLTGGSRTALPRHKTLRAVVDWSWELLTEPERTVLQRLSVFAGGASLEAAEEVCATGTVDRADVLELLTLLSEKSLLLAEGEGAPRYRMLGIIKEYAARRLADAGDADSARRAHLAHFTGLVESAEPQLRRADQLRWLAALKADHDNVSAAVRGALADGDAQSAMRIAASAGFYWWLSGNKAEGVELTAAATKLPGDVDADVQAMVYAMMTTFLTSGRGDEREAEEWIHKAHEAARHGRGRYPLLSLVAPMERMLREPDAILPAWESLLDDADPWVRAMARLQLGKMRIMLGMDGEHADAHLEAALTEFRTIGERFGIAFAQSELADRIAARGGFADACEHFDQAIATVSEIGAVDDVIRMRARQAQLYWLLGDPDAAAAAMGRAERSAERVVWPDALVELALSKAELARWAGDAEEAARQIDVVSAVLGDGADLSYIRAVTHSLHGCLADDLDEARAQHAAACEAAVEAGIAPVVALALVGVADLALRREQYGQAARLTAASTAARGLVDRTQPDLDRIEREARDRLGDAAFAEASREGAEADWTELVRATLDA